MAYPTGINFQFTKAAMGMQPVAETSATQMHKVGTRAQAFDTTYGTAEFIYLLGVVSTVPGDLCFYNGTTGATVRGVAAGATSTGPACVSMSANVAAQYGWYAIQGAVPVTSGTMLANADCYLTSTAGSIDDTVVAGDNLDGMVAKAATSGGFTTCQLHYPSLGAEAGEAAVATLVTDLDTAEAAILALQALGTYCTLSAAAESGNAIVVTGQIKDLAGTNVAVATNVVVRTLAVTADKGDITVTAGTEKKTVNPTTGENVSWIESTAAGAFAVSVANDAAEVTLITATPDNGLAQALVLNFALV